MRSLLMTRRLLLTSLMALSLGCPEPGDPVTPTTQDMSPSPDMSSQDMPGPPPEDMAASLDMSAVPEDLSPPGRTYDSRLGDPEDLGPCDTSIQTHPKPGVRVFLMSFPVDLDATATQESWRDHIHTYLQENVLPCRLEDGHNVVVFPHGLGLHMLLLGDKASDARVQPDATSALATLIARLEPSVGHYRKAFPDASIAQQLLLASTDTVARALVDTFGQLATRYDLHLVVNAPVAPFEATTERALIETLGDADYDELELAYVATQGDVPHAQFLFSPGEMRRAPQVYLGPLERDQLGLTPGTLRDLETWDAPWGPTLAIAGTQTREPDLQARLDDLGVELVLHPDTHNGSWVGAGATTPTLWPADLQMFGTWHMLQHLPRARYAVTSQLTGNLFNLPLDAQVHVAHKGQEGGKAARFVGQAKPTGGHLFIGPWLPGLPQLPDALQAARELLRALGARLLPGSGDPLEGMMARGTWAIDVPNADVDAPQETHPSLVEGAPVLLSTQGRPGARSVLVQRLPAPAQTAGEDAANLSLALPEHDLIRPQAVTDETGGLHIVMEAVGHGLLGKPGPKDNPLAYAYVDPEGRLGRLETLPRAGAWACHPSITRVGGTLHLAFTRLDEDTSRTMYLQGSLRGSKFEVDAGPFADATPQPLDPADDAHHWDARITATQDALLSVWSARREGRWEIWGALSTDAGLSWSTPTQLDAPGPRRTLHATPDATPDGDGFWIAWKHAELEHGHTKITTRRLHLTPNRAPLLSDLITLPIERAWWAASPRFGRDKRGAPVLTYTETDGERTRVMRATLTADGVWKAPKVAYLGERPAGHYGPHQQLTPGGRNMLVFEQRERGVPGARLILLEQ